MEPTENLLTLAPDSVYDVTSYYSTCAGENPLQPSLESAQQLVLESEAAVQMLLDSTCANDQYLLDSLVYFQDVEDVLASMQRLLACPPTQKQFQLVLNEGLCDDSFTGIYIIWLVQFVCAAGILLCSIIVACAYSRFAKRPASFDDRDPIITIDYVNIDDVSDPSAPMLVSSQIMSGG